LRWLGLISYSLYIWHLPLMTFGHYLMPGYDHWNKFAAYGFDWAWMILVALPFCILLYALIERPGMKIGSRWRKALEARYRSREQKLEGNSSQRTKQEVSCSGRDRSPAQVRR
jgi:peptidoglycan/LPS O-acetylase OafA/YrhL